jgi:hypothetical protein
MKVNVIYEQYYSCLEFSLTETVERPRILIIKGKVVLVLNQAPHHEKLWRNGGIAPPFLTLALGGGE